MKIWIDGDACPRDVKDLIFRTAKRKQILTILVANQNQSLPNSPYLQMQRVTAGANVADQHIVDHAEAGDLVITADIPLAAQVIERQCLVISPHGELYDSHNIGERLATRDLLDQLRGQFEMGGGPAPYSEKDRQRFANQLDRLLTKLKKHT